eukprot:Gregarina_sp_Pseudo_9__3551@NODE_370_length_3020_cov_38_161020_g349_i0_p3_GENE_NODE_370_length_3020_cov_38_161020_g349_i0NODE_370_length_3020_cov_38_161020_g349_i0_p3_ORF_typecomplete_len183_score27_78Rad60SLD_2/PF13881_6/0_075DUF805/PF05656_14/0_12_NODE_370_length_3020_cov_38_161020_g349_i037585
MRIKALISSPENVNGVFREWNVTDIELINDTLKKELDPQWLKGHCIRVIFQGRILTVTEGWRIATEGMLAEDNVVHIYIREAPAGSAATTEQGRPRPPRSNSAIWSTVSVLRVQRVLAHDHPGVLFTILIAFTLSIIWWIKLQHPRMLDSFSSFILYGATAATVLITFDKLSRRLHSTPQSD